MVNLQFPFEGFYRCYIIHKLVHILYFSYTGKVKLLMGTDHMGAVSII